MNLTLKSHRVLFFIRTRNNNILSHIPNQKWQSVFLVYAQKYMDLQKKQKKQNYIKAVVIRRNCQ